MDKQNILQDIKKIAPKHCDNCGKKYTNSEFKVIRAFENNALIHLSCAKCGNTYVINAIVNEEGVASQRMPLVLDLIDPKEIDRFADTQPVSKDDIIDIYNLLQDKNIEEKISSKISIKKDVKLNTKLKSGVK